MLYKFNSGVDQKNGESLPSVKVLLQIKSIDPSQNVPFFVPRSFQGCHVYEVAVERIRPVSTSSLPIAQASWFIANYAFVHNDMSLWISAAFRP
jgi:hypothetical protein